MKETERKGFDNIKDTVDHDQWIPEDILGSRKMGEGAQLIEERSGNLDGCSGSARDREKEPDGIRSVPSDNPKIAGLRL